MAAPRDMHGEIREIARFGLRARHPDWTATRVREAFEELMLGVELARTARRGRVARAR
jgi:predicted transcriptional regulator